MKISAICLHYRHLDNTVKCITSLKRAFALQKNLKFEVIIVNNNPQEKLDEIDFSIPVTIIQTKKNLGFAGGNNVGIRQALKKRPDYILLINNDVVVRPKFLKPLLQVFQKDKQAGIVAPAVEHYQKNKKFFGLEGHIHWWQGICKHRNLTYLPQKEISAEFVSACCMLIKREVFQKAGLLPEKYFLYLEDVDYCLSVRKAGFRIYLQPQAVIFHKGGQSFKHPVKKIFYSFSSNLLFIWRWVPKYQKLTAFIFILFFYPYLVLLWSWHQWKKNSKRN